MTRLFKHEFRATSRMILPYLAAAVFSALLFAFTNRMEWFPSGLRVLLVFIIIVSLTALGVVGIVIVISRFYRNVMTDTGYLTMTLPLNSHEFIWAELLMCLCWFVIVTLVLAATVICSLAAGGLLSLPDSFGEIANFFKSLNEALKGHGASVALISVIALEGLAAMILAFFLFCQRIYCCMAVGQLFSDHRVLFSLIAYVMIGIAVTALFGLISNLVGEALSFSSDTLKDSIGRVIEAIGLLDLILLIVNAALYVPTALILDKRLNLT